MERDPSTSDEEDDLETLVPQHDTKHSAPRSTAVFDLVGRVTSSGGAAAAAAGCGRLLWSRRYVLLFVSLPLLFLLLFFSLGGASSLRLPASIRSPTAFASAGAVSARIFKAELRALALLRTQHTLLLKLWNRTVSSSSSSAFPVAPSPLSATTTSVSVLPDELQSALREQIKINQEIQTALLSSHHFGRGNGDVYNASEDNVGFDLQTSGCRKADWPSNRRTIEWRPKKDKFLFAICLSGQMSNHFICLEKHMFFAAILERILVLPSPKLDYQYDRIFDIDHINECFGRKVVMPYQEFAEVRKKKLSIDHFICYVASPPCFLDEEHIKRLKGLGISVGKMEVAWPEDAKLKEPKKRYVGDIAPKFSSDAEVLAVGDMFYADVEEEWLMQPGGPLAHKCKTVIQPSRLIMLTAQRFVQTFLGGNFIALHFRRHGFLKFCNAKKESCFFPIPQAAECILRIIEKANAPVIYLSTDAAGSETNLLQSLVVLSGKPIPFMKRPEHNSVEKWDALLYRNHIGGDNQVEAMLDKTICALSNVFIGSSGSTFTEDILRLRRDWGSASQCDEYLCQGELPNYIAEQE